MTELPPPPRRLAKAPAPPRARPEYIIVPGEARWEDNEIDFRGLPCPPGFVIVDLTREIEVFPLHGRIVAWILWKTPLKWITRRIRKSPYAIVVAHLKRLAPDPKAQTRDAAKAE